jgi:hypothetical protein
VTLVLPNPADPFDGAIDLHLNYLNVPTEADYAGAGAFHQWFDDWTGPPWSTQLAVVPGTTFTLSAAYASYVELPNGLDLPLHGMIVRQEGPYAVDSDVDVDFTTLTPSTSVLGSFARPTRTGSSLRTSAAYVEVSTSWTPNPGRHFLPIIGDQIGWPTHLETSADGVTVDYEVTHASPDFAASPAVRYYCIRDYSWGGGGHFTMVDVGGYPTEGAQTFVLLDLPEMTDPVDPAVTHPLHTPFAWELFDAGVTPTLYVRSSRVVVADTNLWWITATTDATTLTVPEPPSGVDVAAVLGTEELHGVLGILADDPGDVRARYSESDAFLIQP